MSEFNCPYNNNCQECPEHEKCKHKIPVPAIVLLPPPPEKPSNVEPTGGDRVTYENLRDYTTQFKEWIFKLIRRIHARIGHVEEDLAKLKRQTARDYELVEGTTDAGETSYTLYDNITQTSHGSIIMSGGTGGSTSYWHEDGNGHD